MSSTFVTNLEIQVQGGSVPTKKYSLKAADEMTLMSQSNHLNGMQTDLASLNRTQIASDPQQAQRNKSLRAAASVTLVISSQTKDDAGNSCHSLEYHLYGLDKSTIPQVQAIISSHLVAVGLTP